MLRRAEGFLACGTDNAALVASGNVLEANGTILSGAGRNGGNCYRLSSNARIRTGFEDNLTEVVFGFAYRLVGSVPSSTADRAFFQLLDRAAAPQLSFRVYADGSIEVRRGSSSTGGTSLGFTAPGVLTADTYFFIEVKATASNTVGAVEMRVNGVTVFNITGVDTVQTSNVEFAQLRIETNAGTGSVPTDVADLYVFDTTGSYNNDFAGDHYILEDVVDADGSENDWTPLSGSTRWEMVDEIPPDGDTSYISAGTVGDRQTLSFPDLPADVTGVRFVQIFHTSRKDDAGDGSIEVGVISNGTELMGDEVALSQTWTGYRSNFDTDPDTGLPWSISRANQVTAVLERTL